jgi:pSer/pThr/pTyr-binding forkhead associated (FHA) protein
MGTAGKVKINGEMVETAEVKDGDEIFVGPYRVVIFHGDRYPATEPPADMMNNNIPGSEEAQNSEEPPPDPNFVPEEQVNPLDNNAAGNENVYDGNFGSPEPQAAGGLPVEGSVALSHAETVVEMKPLVAKLVFLEGPRKGEELFLETYEVSFGRSKKADIYLDDPKLSRIHAKIARVGMGYRLLDCNSRHGTYVNGVRVLEHPLNSFDTLEFGSTKIKFLIHDVLSNEMGKGALVEVSQSKAPALPSDSTKSMQWEERASGVVLDFKKSKNNEPALYGQSPKSPEIDPEFNGFKKPGRLSSQKTKILLVVFGVLLVALFMIPSKKDTGSITKPETAQKGPQPPALPAIDAKLSPQMSKEFLELSPEAQRAVEGYYNTALKSADHEAYDEAVLNLKKIHEILPYYKQSREMMDQYTKKLKEKQIVEATEKAKKDEKQELALLLEEGMDNLKEGEFDKAAEAFNSAITLDPNNQTALKGLKAAEYKVKRFEDIPPEKDPEQEKRKMVGDLFQQAVEAFRLKSYQQAIEKAEAIRKVELKGDTQYLNEAKQIIDKAKMLQKEEFEPFLIQAKEKFAEGDYNSSRDLCDEMLKRDPAYDEAKECVLKAKKQLNRLAKEAYTHGYILESMNRIEEAKQYWNRAKNYIRPGDDYYDKVNKKLEYYQ